MKQIDTYGRTINYLRISITDRCNLRCTYCMPPEGISLINHEDILRYEEITRLAHLAYEIGFTKFRITGGEPLVRKGVPNLISDIAKFGENIDLSLTTNGILLAKYAKELKSAGLHRINISLDTLNSEKFLQISRFDLFHEVMNGIKSAIEVGFDPIKINVVVVKGINDDEIIDFVEMTKDQPLCVRFIELMPFLSEEQNGKIEWQQEKFISSDEIKKRIEEKYLIKEIIDDDNSTPAREYVIEGHKGRIGFISPLSHKFCHYCNRIRLTADGRLLPCLMDNIEIDVKTPMRNKASDDELKSIIQSAMQSKPEGHSLCNDSHKKLGRSMSRVGG
jgi:cyclic pyranopterin phosphate synthase